MCIISRICKCFQQSPQTLNAITLFVQHSEKRVNNHQNTSKPLRNSSRVNFLGRAYVQIFNTILTVSQPYWELLFSFQGVPEALPAWASLSSYQCTVVQARQQGITICALPKTTLRTGRRDGGARVRWCRITYQKANSYLVQCIERRDIFN